MIPINEIRCVDIGHGKGQMAMLMARVFGCAVGFDVQQDMNKIVIAELFAYWTLSDRVLLMQCDLLRFGSFNG
jgi:ubiquinone/menaquinone biosynthesis C-methylase UbiE